MFKLLIISILSLSIGVSFEQPEINYNHKRLYKELEKNWGMDNPKFEEILVPDSLKQNFALQGKFFKILNDNVSQHYIYVGRVNSCRAGGCSIASDIDFNTEMEYFDYFIIYNAQITVQQVRVFNYQATHGHEVSAKGWLNQFRGYNGAYTLEVGKNVDAITGATISVYGITEDVQFKTILLGKLF